MCTQDYVCYTCGCRAKTEFHQCDEKYDAGINKRCAKMRKNDIQSRNYCANHLLEEGKGEVMYSDRRRKDPVEDTQAPNQ